MYDFFLSTNDKALSMRENILARAFDSQVAFRFYILRLAAQDW